MKSRTPSDFVIVAIFRDKRKPQNAARGAFPLDFMGIFQRYDDTPALVQGGLHRLGPVPDKQGRQTLPLLMRTPRIPRIPYVTRKPWHASIDSDDGEA